MAIGGFSDDAMSVIGDWNDFAQDIQGINAAIDGNPNPLEALIAAVANLSGQAPTREMIAMIAQNPNAAVLDLVAGLQIQVPTVELGEAVDDLSARLAEAIAPLTVEGTRFERIGLGATISPPYTPDRDVPVHGEGAFLA